MCYYNGACILSLGGKCYQTDYHYIEDWIHMYQIRLPVYSPLSWACLPNLNAIPWTNWTHSKSNQTTYTVSPICDNISGQQLSPLQ